MSKFFPNWQKAVGTIIMVAAGVLVFRAVDKFFGIEQKLPRNDMRAA